MFVCFPLNAVACYIRDMICVNFTSLWLGGRLIISGVFKFVTQGEKLDLTKFYFDTTPKTKNNFLK